MSISYDDNHYTTGTSYIKYIYKNTVDHCTVSRWLKKFCSGCKNLNNLARSGKPKSMDSNAMLQVIAANPQSSTQRVSGEFNISQFIVVHFFHDSCKSISCWQIELWAMKILQSFWFTQVLSNSLNHLKNSNFVTLFKMEWGCHHSVMVKAVDCGIVVSEFVLQSHYYIHFWANNLGKGMNPLILPAMG